MGNVGAPGLSCGRRAAVAEGYPPNAFEGWDESHDHHSVGSRPTALVAMRPQSIRGVGSAGHGGEELATGVALVAVPLARDLLTARLTRELRVPVSGRKRSSREVSAGRSAVPGRFVSR